MEQEDYPEKIYAFQSKSNGGGYTHKSLEEYIAQKYTRAYLVPKWHKFPEEEPDEWTTYLVTTKYGTVTIADYDVDFWHNIVHNDVIAWMELPKPYKEE